MHYGKPPGVLGEFKLNLPEVMYYLYLPIRMRDTKRFGDAYVPMEVQLPKNLEVIRPLLQQMFFYAYQKDNGPKRDILDDYWYVSARKGWATPDNPLNRPGWHCDGFGTDDLNFVWWKGAGTRFLVHRFPDDAGRHKHAFQKIPADHKSSIVRFEELVRDAECNKYSSWHGIKADYSEQHLYVIDPFVIHSTPEIKVPGMRTYIKISLSKHRYNLENNSHNYAFNYSWPLHKRHEGRNNTGRDYVNA